jgi:hypothetical protein
MNVAGSLLRDVTSVLWIMIAIVHEKMNRLNPRLLLFSFAVYSLQSRDDFGRIQVEACMIYAYTMAAWAPGSSCKQVLVSSIRIALCCTLSLRDDYRPLSQFLYLVWIAVCSGMCWYWSRMPFFIVSLVALLGVMLHIRTHLLRMDLMEWGGQQSFVRVRIIRSNHTKPVQVNGATLRP